MEQTTRLRLTELNEHLVCVLCAGYLVDATTVVECLHSFCRSCIVRHLEANKSCPKCDDVIHKTKPLINLRPDRALQTLVYKLVPSLYQNEMNRRRKYYSETPSAVPISDEDGGAVADSHLIYTEDEKISLCLQHCDRLPSLSHVKAGSTGALAEDPKASKDSDKRHLLCPALLTIGHLKKFIRHKFDLAACYQIEVFHTRVSLKDACTLMDIANIYSWKRTDPLRLYYLVFDKTRLSLDLPEPSDKPIITTTVRLPKKSTEPRRKYTKKSTKHHPLDKAAKSSVKSPKKGLVKSKRFQPPPSERVSTSIREFGNVSGPVNRDVTVCKDRTSPGPPEEDVPLSELKTKLKTSQPTQESQNDSVPDVIIVDGDCADNKTSKKTADSASKGSGGVSNKQTNNSPSAKKLISSKDKVKKVQSIKLLASKLVNLNGKLFDSDKKHKRSHSDKTLHDPSASGPNKSHLKSPLKYNKLSTKSRKSQQKSAKTATKTSKLVTSPKSESPQKVADEYDFDIECAKDQSIPGAKSPRDIPIITESNVTTKGDTAVVVDTASDCKCVDKPASDESVVPAKSTVTPVPSPTLHQDSGDDVVTTDITPTSIDLINQPDLVRSNLMSTQPRTCQCGASKRPLDPESVSKDEEPVVSKPRMEVISSPADTSSPQLDVNKLPEDYKSEDTPQDVEASPRTSSPPSPVDKVTVTQSDSTTHSISPAPSVDSGGRDSKATTPEKPAAPAVVRARKISDTSARDKAKSINSIIKRIEERNHGMQKKMETSPPPNVLQKTSAQASKAEEQRIEPQRHTPQPSGRLEPQATPRSANSPHSTVSSPSPAHLVANSPAPSVSFMSGCYSPSPTMVCASPSSTHNQLTQPRGAQRGRRPTQHPETSFLLGALQKAPRPQKASKPRAGKRSLPQTNTDTTPIKRLRQMCNGFGNNSILAKQLQDQIASPYQTKGGYMDPRIQYPPPGSKPVTDKQQRPIPAARRTPDARAMRSPQHVQPPTPYQRLHGNTDATDRRPGYTPLVGDQFTSVPPAVAHSNGLLSPRPAPHTCASASAPPENLRPAHSHNYKAPYYPAYTQPNPRANGYDEPLELTTKPAQDRKRAEDTTPPSGATFLKIPSLVKP